MTAPDPRFRDQLDEAATLAVGDMAEDWWCPKRDRTRRTECRYCIADAVLDALMPTIAAEVEARVQAAANQRAAEELRAIGRAGLAATPGNHPVRVPVSYLFDRAAALDP